MTPNLTNTLELRGWPAHHTFKYRLSSPECCSFQGDYTAGLKELYINTHSVHCRQDNVLIFLGYV